MSRWSLIIGCIFAGCGIIAGAVGTHVLRAQLTVESYAAYQTAVEYLLMHGVGLVALGSAASVRGESRLFKWGLAGIVVGTLLFSGGLLGWTIRAWDLALRCAPMGGTLLILSWFTLALAIFRARLRRF